MTSLLPAIALACAAGIGAADPGSPRCGTPEAEAFPSQIECARVGLPSLVAPVSTAGVSGSQNPGSLSPAIRSYLRYYGLPDAEGPVRVGSFQSGHYTLMGQVFFPKNPRGSVILVHGYLDHSGLHSRFIRACLDRGLAVAALDLPGHGLSAGERADIADFGAYGRALGDFIAAVSPLLPGAPDLVCHSMGCAAALEFLQTTPEARSRRLVLVAPLMRSAHWSLARMCEPLLRPFVSTVRRRFRVNTADRDFAAFVRQDPLRPARVPLRWFRSLVRWNKGIRSLPFSSERILILQGTDDGVVDWRYNLTTFRSLLPSAKAATIEGGKHQLLNEAPPIRDPVYAAIFAHLESP